MIGSLRGAVLHTGDSDVIIDVAGIGYRVTVTASTRSALSVETVETTLWIHTQLRQDALQLYGFSSIAERDLFEILLTTPGVGPSLALAILGTLGAVGVVHAVASDDTKAFESVSGVGKKTAARLVLELQGRLTAFDGLGAGAPRTEGHVGEERGEVVAALSQLGYSSDEVKRAVTVLDGTETIETALRLALRELSHR